MLNAVKGNLLCWLACGNFLTTFWQCMMASISTNQLSINYTSHSKLFLKALLHMYTRELQWQCDTSCRWNCTCNIPSLQHDLQQKNCIASCRKIDQAFHNVARYIAACHTYPATCLAILLSPAAWQVAGKLPCVTVPLILACQWTQKPWQKIVKKLLGTNKQHNTP